MKNDVRIVKAGTNFQQKKNINRLLLCVHLSHSIDNEICSHSTFLRCFLSDFGRRIFFSVFWTFNDECCFISFFNGHQKSQRSEKKKQNELPKCFPKGDGSFVFFALYLCENCIEALKGLWNWEAFMKFNENKHGLMAK